jgi:uncharacterized protein (TIGR02266 family)
LIAHRRADVRDRFAAALADARHGFVLADTAPAACAAAADAGTPISLALLDLGLDGDALTFVEALQRAAERPLPVLVFAGSLGSATQVAALAEAHVGGYINEHAATSQILPALAPHLFPDNFDRRASPRVALGVPVTYRSGSTIATAHALNLGKGGLAVRTMTPLAAGSPVHLKFRLPRGHGEIDASGRVAWSDRKTGMGVQFDRLDAATQAAIDQFVDESL